MNEVKEQELNELPNKFSESSFLEHIKLSDLSPEANVYVIVGMNGCGKTRLHDKIMASLGEDAVSVNLINHVKSHGKEHLAGTYQDLLKEHLIKETDSKNYVLMDNFGDGMHLSTVEDSIKLIVELSMYKKYIIFTHNPMTITRGVDVFYMKDGVLSLNRRSKDKQ